MKGREMRKKIAVVGIVLIGLYAVAGFVVAPAILKPRLVEALKQSTSRSVHLGGLRVNRQGERLHWRGNISLAPLRSAGLIELAGIHARTLTDFMGDRLQADSGTFSARTEYSLESRATGTSFTLRNGRLDVTRLVLSSPLDSLPPISMPSLHAGCGGLIPPECSFWRSTSALRQRKSESERR